MLVPYPAAGDQWMITYIKMALSCSIVTKTFVLVTQDQDSQD